MLIALVENSFFQNTLYSIWFWLSFIEAFIIIKLLFFNKGKTNNIFTQIINTTPKADEESMKNMVNSIFLAKQLYAKLKIKYHPDKFFNEEQKEVANEIFQNLTRNKNNYSALKDIENEAKSKLDV